jgi:trans-2,3-dihydro-3-hydroxyanthranilate isomerase
MSKRLVIHITGASGGGVTMIDVFAERPYEGNPMAVVNTGTSMLGPGQRMQIAREFGNSATAFLGRTRSDTWTLAIHTPTREVPFAGQPVLGAAACARSCYDAGPAVQLETGCGPAIVRRS